MFQFIVPKNSKIKKHCLTKNFHNMSCVDFEERTSDIFNTAHNYQLAQGKKSWEKSMSTSLYTTA